MSREPRKSLDDRTLVISPAVMKALSTSMERMFCPGFIGPLPRPRTKEENEKAAAAFDRALKDPNTKFLCDEF